MIRDFFRLPVSKTIFYLAIIIRLLIMPFFFHPDIKTYNFQSSFLKQGVINIYPYLIENREKLPLKEEFVYFPLTYLFLGTYQALASPLLGANFESWLSDASGRAVESVGTFRYLLLLKLPYLIFDILIAFVLVRLVEAEALKRKIFTLWLFNPFTLALIYVFSNVDVIPVFLVLVSLLLFRKRKAAVSSGALALAVGFKAYPVVFFPFLLARARSFKEFATLVSVFIAASLAIIVPFWSPAFIYSSFASGLTTRILEAGIAISGGEKILLAPLALVLIFFLGLSRPQIKLWKLFMATLVVIFSSIHFHIQWLLWAAPFMVMLWVSQEKYRLPILLISLSAFLIPILYNDRFMSVALLSPVSNLFELIPAPFAVVQRVMDPLMLISVFHSFLIGTGLFLLWGTLGGRKR